MSRSILISLACVSLAVAPFVVGCDKSGADAQAQANEAQNKANVEVTNAKVEADNKIANAQANANQQIAAANGDFMKTREDYRHTVQSNLDALNKKIADLDAKATTDNKPDLKAALPALKAQRDSFVTNFQRINTVDALTWDTTKTNLDKQWNDLKSAVDKAG